MKDTPFDSLESAYQYVSLLAAQVEDVDTSIADDIQRAEDEGAARRRDALHLVDYKLKQLAHHLTASRRILNDLRTLRRLLVDDRAEATPVPLAVDTDSESVAST